jgi:hypothetical protein
LSGLKLTFPPLPLAVLKFRFRLTNTRSTHRVSVNPKLRSTIFNLALGVPINYTATNQKQSYVAAHEFMNSVLLGPIKKVAPDGGAYLSEASPYEQEWKRDFYGGNYDELLKVKDKYDPAGLFYAWTGVGSDRWTERADGRLCRVEGMTDEVVHSEL